MQHCRTVCVLHQTWKTSQDLAAKRREQGEDGFFVQKSYKLQVEPRCDGEYVRRPQGCTHLPARPADFASSSLTNRILEIHVQDSAPPSQVRAPVSGLSCLGRTVQRSLDEEVRSGPSCIAQGQLAHAELGEVWCKKRISKTTQQSQMSEIWSSSDSAKGRMSTAHPTAWTYTPCCSGRARNNRDVPGISLGDGNGSKTMGGLARQSVATNLQRDGCQLYCMQTCNARKLTFVYP